MAISNKLVILGVFISSFFFYGVFKFDKTTKLTSKITNFKENKEKLEYGNFEHTMRDHFEIWKEVNGKQYLSIEEEELRFENFKKSHKRVEKLKNSNINYQVHLGKFADLSEEEFKSKYLGYGYPSGIQNSIDNSNIETTFLNKDYNPENKKIEQNKKELFETTSIDWEKKGALNPPRNQGQCGSCFSFASTAVLEAWNFIKTNKLEQYSDQMALDCSKGYGNLACLGGYPHLVFQYVKTYGIMYRKDYTYNGEGWQECRYDAKKAVKPLKHFEVIEKDGAKMLEALKTTPLVVALNHAGLMHYKSGIIGSKLVDGSTCPQELTHAVVLYGYGITKSGKKYWKVRNTWGKDWGMRGNFYIEFDPNSGPGTCGIQAKAVRPMDLPQQSI